MNPARPLRICLAGSGGGHVRQLLDLKPLWAELDYFFVTEDTALGRSLSAEHPTHFVPHYAAGQARLGAPLKMLGGAALNFLRSFDILTRERPDVIVSTGAGAMFFTVILGRLSGAKIVVVDSFARFENPSLFARLAAPFSHQLVVQSAKLRARFPKARVFDPLRIVEGEPPAKKPLLFATVGATLPFDRLATLIAEAKRRGAVPESVLLQTGLGGRRPPGVDTVETLPFDRVQEVLAEADIVLCHGGTGSIITALRQGCKVIAIPRRSDLGEHYDDHQQEITQAFAARGLIQVADNIDELELALQRARASERRMATTAPDELIAFLKDYLRDVGRGRD